MNERDFNDLIVCAVRYALGRRTYIVSSVVDIAKKNVDIMQNNTKMAIIDSIVKADDLGDSIDAKEWNELLKCIADSLEEM